MTDDVEREMQKHLQTIHDLAIRIVESSDTGQRAFVTAAGVLAGVIHTTVVDDHREAVISAAVDAIRDHLKLLDELAGVGASLN